MAGKGGENDFKFKLCLISFDDKYHNDDDNDTSQRYKGMIMCLIKFVGTFDINFFQAILIQSPNKHEMNFIPNKHKL